MINIKYFFGYLFFAMFASGGLLCIFLSVNSLLKGEGAVSLIPLLFVFTHGGVGFYGIRWLTRSIKMKKWLKEHGTEVEAIFKISKVVGLRTQSNVLICTWTHSETKISYEFESRNIRNLPQNLVPNQTIFKVLIDWNDPTRYWYVHQLNMI
jgi:hypothetical protein